MQSRHSLEGSRRPRFSITLPLYRTKPTESRAARHQAGQKDSQRIRDGSAAGRNDLEYVRDDHDVVLNDLAVERNNLQLDRDNFSARAIVGTPDASSYMHDRHAPGA